jgi:hypothetical protein
MLTSDGFGASGASFGEEFAEAVGAVGLLVARREPLSSERRVTIGACEALAMPRLVLICHASLCDDLEPKNVVVKDQ